MAGQVDHAVVGVLVEQDGKFLLVRESKPGREGLYNTPGGHVEPHETLFESAIREVREESGYEIELTGLLTVYQTILPHINVSGPVFAARVVGGSAKPTAGHPEVRWFSIEALRQLEADSASLLLIPCMPPSCCSPANCCRSTPWFAYGRIDFWRWSCTGCCWGNYSQCA